MSENRFGGLGERTTSHIGIGTTIIIGDQQVGSESESSYSFILSSVYVLAWPVPLST